MRLQFQASYPFFLRFYVRKGHSQPASTLWIIGLRQVVRFAASLAKGELFEGT